MTLSLLTVHDLHKSYQGVAAVRGVSFSMAAGEVLAMIGPNGAGKSTCFGMLDGQIRPDSGRIELGTEDVTGEPPRRLARNGVARTFQITSVFASMTTRENVQTACVAQADLSARPVGRADRHFIAEADQWLGEVGLLDQATRPASELAYGDIKRLELAMALACKPRLLLMDEPTAGMARKERYDIMAFVTAYTRRNAIGLLFTEHDTDIVFSHAHRVMVLDRGRLIAVGEPDAVRRDPMVIASYLGEAGASSAEQGGAPC